MTAPISAEETLAFTHYLDGWMAGLPRPALAGLCPDPARTAIVSVDVINGFCYEGPLSSPRVAGIVQPIVRLFEHAWDYGIRQIALTQDTHEPDAVEFAQWPAHCVRGTAEAETVAAFKSLPFFDSLQVFPKNSIHSGMETGFPAWVAARPQVNTWVVVGDCTDLCAYQLAMDLRLEANARQLARRIIVPADCVDTYDMSIETARAVQAMPHPANLIHPLFLYHMALNGVEVVAGID